MEYFDILQLGMFDSFLWATNVLYHLGRILVSYKCFISLGTIL